MLNLNHDQNRLVNEPHTLPHICCGVMEFQILSQIFKRGQKRSIIDMMSEFDCQDMQKTTARVLLNVCKNFIWHPQSLVCLVIRNFREVITELLNLYLLC